MTTSSHEHLNDAQFTDCMLDVGLAPEAEAHLAACGHCQEELARFRVAVDDLSLAGLAWSQAHAPQGSLRAAKKTPRWAVAAWGAAAFAMLALGVTPLLHHEHPARDTQVATVTEPVEDSDAQIAQDNKLMHAVNMEIAEGEPSPYREYQLSRGQMERRKAHLDAQSEMRMQ